MFVEFLLQFLNNPRRAHHPIQQRTAGIARRVAARYQLRQRLGRQLRAPQRLPIGVLPLHQPGEQIHTVGIRVLEALAHARDCNAGQVLDGPDALAEERVGEVLRVRFQLRQAAERAADLAAPVEHLDRGGERRGRIGRLADLGDVAAVLEHAEGGAEGEIADDVEGEVVEPVQGVDAGVAGLWVFLSLGQFGPAVHEHVEVGVDVLLELANGFGGEGVRHDLALPGVLGAVACVEETAVDADEGIVVFAAMKLI